MLIAIPHFLGRVSPVFDVASRLIVVRVKGRLELERREVTLFEAQPDRITRSLVELGVKVLVCGAISQMFERMLHSTGVRVVGQVCGGGDDRAATSAAGGGGCASGWDRAVQARRPCWACWPA